AGKAGLLVATVEEQTVRAMWAILEADPSTAVEVDLQTKRISAGSLAAQFDIDDYTRWRLLHGLDDIAITLGHEADIAVFEAQRPAFKPTTP
ncbi:MAG: 3-isopropylmalate dehydratase small subunit, partial [Nocardioidaceae bacterium]